MSSTFSITKYNDLSSFSSVLKVCGQIDLDQTGPELSNIYKQIIVIALYEMGIDEGNLRKLGLKKSTPSDSNLTLNNLRGRSANTLSPDQFKAHTSNNGVTPEELLFIEGEISHPPFSIGDDLDPSLAKLADEVIQRPKQDYQLSPFEYRTLTIFNCFKNRKTISHDVYNYPSEIMLLTHEGISLKDFLSNSDVTVDNFRIGFERFKSRLLFSLFGLVPTISEKLYIENTNKSITLVWEKIKNISLPSTTLEENDLIYKFLRLLEKNKIALNLVDQLKTKLT